MSLTLAKQRYASGARSNPDRDEVVAGYRRRAKRRATEAWGVTLASCPKQILESVPDWDDRINYTADQLLLQAERILCSDPTPLQEHPAVLRWDRLKERKKREIHNKNGVPDPSVCQGIYWRSHPQGRKLSTPEQRTAEKGGGFYA